MVEQRAVDDLSRPSAEAPWLLALLPALAPLVAVVGLLAHLPVTAGPALLVLLGLSAAVAWRDRGQLIRDEKPPLVLLLVPPAYLAARALRGRDARPALVWFLAAAASFTALALATDRLAPVAADSQQVQERLLSSLLVGDLAVDPASGEVSCPAFDRLWPSQHVTCTAWDAQRRVAVELSASPTRGIRWHVAG